jgi:hypothetical protein
MKKLIRELIIEACSVLQHDTDIADGKEGFEVTLRESLEERFRRVLTKHRKTKRAAINQAFGK